MQQFLKYNPLPLLILMCTLALVMTETRFAAGQENDSDKADRQSETTDDDFAKKFQSALRLGKVKIELKPMVPTQKIRGLQWSPKGNKAPLTATDEGLRGQIRIGSHPPIALHFDIEKPLAGGPAVLKIDSNGDQKFSADETIKIDASERRDKFWYSAKTTFDLRIDDKTSRPYPVSLWYVVDPEDSDQPPVFRWSRTGWHQGEFEFNGTTCTVVITDADSDGMFTDKDAWGLGTSDKDAYSYKNSAFKCNSHAWLDSVAFRIADSDENGQSVTIEAFDLGMTEAEDRAKRDPYAADRKYARAEKPVAFLKDLDAALALAKKEGKRIVVDFETTWCGPCKVMDQLVYTAKPVVEISKDFVFVKLDGDEEKELNDKFEVKAYPTMILLDSDGKTIRRAVGYQNVKAFIEFLK